MNASTCKQIGVFLLTAVSFAGCTLQENVVFYPGPVPATQHEIGATLVLDSELCTYLHTTKVADLGETIHYSLGGPLCQYARDVGKKCFATLQVLDNNGIAEAKPGMPIALYPKLSDVSQQFPNDDSQTATIAVEWTVKESATGSNICTIAAEGTAKTSRGPHTGKQSRRCVEQALSDLESNTITALLRSKPIQDFVRHAVVQK
jgi:hypothetical protein